MKQIFLLFFVFYFPLALVVGFSWLQSDNILSVLSFAVWQLFLAKTVYEIVRTIFVLVVPKQLINSQKSLNEYPAVALLYVCCDDIVPECLLDLKKQNYPNIDIFVLDDSSTSEFRAMADTSQYHVVRRDDRRGYKAGNLNNWLKKYGHCYKYFMIFDNDSKASPDFIEQMVKFAEHPENHDVGIFQSKVFSWNEKKVFPRISGIMAPVFMKVLGIFGNRTGTVISFGHNNLHRVDAIKSIGGFDEELTAEDIVATLMLDQIGYKTILVDVESFEAEPENLLRFRRRAVRWAGQTVSLFKRPWAGVSGPLKFEISRQLLNYLINSLFFCLAFGVLWSSETTLGSIFTLESYKFIPNQINTFSLVMGVFLSNQLLAFLLAYKNGINIRKYFEGLFFNLATNIYVFIPVLKALINGFFGKKIIFHPSNAGNLLYSPRKIWLNSFPLLAIGFFSLFRYFWILDKNPWAYWGGWWATIFLLIPVFLQSIHRNEEK